MYDCVSKRFVHRIPRSLKRSFYGYFTSYSDSVCSFLSLGSLLVALKSRIQILFIFSFIYRFIAMEKLRNFYDREIVLHATDNSLIADGQLSRWSNKDLDPVPKAQKK